MNLHTFEEIRSIVYSHSGIRLQDGKETMVSSRIAQRLRALALTDEKAYVGYLKSHLEHEIIELLDVISTNVTHFFRESEHFDHLKGFVEEWMAKGQRRFRFWSAACSTGEEPYSLAMTLRDFTDSGGLSVDMRILATDISTRVLEQAKRGIFDAKKIERVPEKLKHRYLHERHGANGTTYEVKPSLGDMLLFKRVNLSTPPFPMQGPMDVIFCRNVMIYFDDPVRNALIKEFHRLLRPGGYLIVGKSESLLRSGELLEHAGPSIYRKAA